MQISTHKKYLHFYLDFWLSSKYFANDFAITVYSFETRDVYLFSFLSIMFVKTDLLSCVLYRLAAYWQKFLLMSCEVEHACAVVLT